MKPRYELDGVGIPSVTEIIHAVLGSGYGMRADEYYLQRGRAVHACAALIAQGKEFDYDEQIHGQVEACREFFKVYQPEVIAVEEPKISKLYRFAGTIDLIAKIKGKKVIVDYKASVPKTVNIQLGGYGEIHDINRGMTVVLGADGTFKASKIIDLKIHRREFLACLTVFNLKGKIYDQ